MYLDNRKLMIAKMFGWNVVSTIVSITTKMGTIIWNKKYIDNYLYKKWNTKYLYINVIPTITHPSYSTDNYSCQKWSTKLICNFYFSIQHYFLFILEDTHVWVEALFFFLFQMAWIMVVSPRKYDTALNLAGGYIFFLDNLKEKKRRLLKHVYPLKYNHWCTFYCQNINCIIRSDSVSKCFHF